MPNMRYVWKSALLGLGVSVFLIACGDDPQIAGDGRSLCGDETRADTFVVGMEKPTFGDNFSVRLMDTEVEGNTVPPDRGHNVWTFEILDSNRMRVQGAVVTLRPWMPDHGHGTTPLVMEAVETDGVYSFGPFDLFMGGFWEFGVHVEAAEQADDTKFGFCLEG